MTRTVGQAEVSRDRGDCRQSELLPPSILPLFDVSFVRSHLLYDEFIYRLVLQVVRETVLEQAMREPGTPAEIAARAGARGRTGPCTARLDAAVPDRPRPARGDVGRSVFRYTSRGPFPTLDPAPIQERADRLDAVVDAGIRPGGDGRAGLSGVPAAARSPARTCSFAPRRLRLWIDYFSNDNGLYVVNNRLGAVAVEQWLPRIGSVVLELGGGLGSGALALLERLEATGRLGAISEYRFTELVPAFLRRGEQALRTRHPGSAQASRSRPST